MSESSGVEIFFYHLQRQPLAAVLPQLVEKCLERGWRVRHRRQPRRSASRRSTTTFGSIPTRALSHMPVTAMRTRSATPWSSTLAGTNPNGAQVRFLVENAAVLPDDAANYSKNRRFVDGDDEGYSGLARATWRTVRESGYQATYWQQYDSGRWEKKA